jgi:hypothetical protein
MTKWKKMREIEEGKMKNEMKGSKEWVKKE